MISKIIFAIALALVVLWIYLIASFDKFIYIHVAAVLALIGFLLSHFMKNQKPNRDEEEE